MAFAHCHRCAWSQDDFWSWRQNPITVFFRIYVPTYFKPHFMWVETGGAKLNNFKRVKRHTWWLLVKAVWWMLVKIFTMHWWTYESWRKDYRRGYGMCPKCGNCICID